ncbi:hypothetical protein HL653_23825 (plasmid) [Sphingomonas sp. AP4-R1]|uniref:hypothetical protein n=1 Tax=Sphingomonas sp. AP4-R1 TaxID=2735134 RepID=UPI0014934313|nr:hypothetical protein [Sphingomonas sp. AP4-R1]QJU60943.1 hypothetical protein HL653_23825 [Sphingomonas sp. AP4-R1]
MAGEVCRWTSQKDALEAFAGFQGKIESAGQIKPLHWYVACRLVLEGGFDPADITPRPPFRIQTRSGKPPLLHYDESKAGGGERTILGGLKTKNVDVVVTRDGLGPVLAVSCKGVTAALRNLTNRLEETVGECTNLHITYPALVLGYLVVLRANRQVDSVLEDALAEAAEAEAIEEKQPGRALTKNDIAMGEGGEPVALVMRFHNALREMTGRRGIRNDVSRYEAIGFGMVEMEPSALGTLLDSYPAPESTLRLERFFETLYLRHDERFVTSAPDLASKTRRLEWASDSPALALPELDYEPRVAS